MNEPVRKPCEYCTVCNGYILLDHLGLISSHKTTIMIGDHYETGVCAGSSRPGKVYPVDNS